MPPALLTRRETLLSLTAAGAISLSGCPSPYRRNPAGRLTITNNRGQEHTVTLTVTKTSQDRGYLRRVSTTPAPETTPIWTHEQTVTIGPRGEIIEDNYIDEPGAFYLEARLDTSETDIKWFWLAESARGLGGPEIWVSIPATGFMTVSAIADD